MIDFFYRACQARAGQAAVGCIHQPTLIKPACTVGMFLAAAVAISTISAQAFACSDVIMKIDGLTQAHIASARTLDFPDIEQQGVEMVRWPRGQQWTGMAPGGQPGKRVDNGRYGFVGVTMLPRVQQQLGLDHFGLLDGLNEKGLSAAVLWLDAAAYAPDPSPRDALHTSEVVPYLLGCCATVDEAIAAIQPIQVWTDTDDPGSAFFLPQHVVVHDANGDSAVFEWVATEAGGYVLNIYDSLETAAIGALANDPTYPIQQANLALFADLTPDDGLDGLPGACLSVANFTRLHVLREYAVIMDSPSSALSQAMHAIARVESLKGEDRALIDGVAHYDFTGHTWIRDHTDPTYYFRGHFNPLPRKLRLADMDFDQPGFQLLPVDVDPDSDSRYPFGLDVTETLNAPTARILSDGNGGYLVNLDLRVGNPGGDTRNIYIWARTPQGTLYSYTPRREWRRVINNELLAAGVAHAASHRFNAVLEQADYSALKDTKIFAGVGQNPTDMLLNQQYSLVYVVRDDYLIEDGAGSQ